MLVSNIRENGVLIGSQGDGTLGFHSDGAFNDIPTSASLLYGIEIPTTGGDTLFVNMNEVYESLSKETKNLIADKWAVNYHSYDRNGVETGRKAEERGKAVRHATHPMVIAHPITGKPILFVNCLNSREIIGMDPAVATPLLSDLFARIEHPELIYAHKWRKGDLLIWDNRCLQHGRSDWEPRERRLLRRFAVKNKTRPQPYTETVKSKALRA
jgi:taurine dioxygenase